VEERLVDEAPAPAFAGLERADDRVTGLLEVEDGVAVLRVRAAAPVAAREADAEGDPAPPGRDAFGADVADRLDLEIDVALVRARQRDRHRPRRAGSAILGVHYPMIPSAVSCSSMAALIPSGQ